MIGDPIDHSFSPRLFAFLFAELGIDAIYTALRIAPGVLAETVELARRGRFVGLSVTLPHKEAIVPLLDDLDGAAARVGAVNVVARDGEGRLHGHNTDVAGVQKALEVEGGRADDARVLLLGAGGAARAAAFALSAAGASSITIANRDPERAARLARALMAGDGAHRDGDRYAPRGIGERPCQMPGPTQPHLLSRRLVTAVPLQADPLAEPLANADLIINATSCGLDAPADDPLPAGLALEPRHTVLDMVYRPLETALLARARAAGATCIDGLWMLAFQAIAALQLWTGHEEPDLAPRIHDLLAGMAP